MVDTPRLFLIDGHALAYRTYYALTRGGEVTHWITKSGEPTAGTFGFTSVLLSLLEKERPEYLAVSFDTGRSFREDLYPEYKATREKMPDDLRVQIERIRELVQAFGIPVLDAEGYEADDVLGTVAEQASQQGVQVIIITGDKDLLQLADETVTIRLSGQRLSDSIDYDPKEVKEKYGLTPEQLLDYKALIGDSSDNIPGVYGVGEKTAKRLLQKYRDLEGIYNHLQDIGTRFRNKLEEGKKEAELSRELGRIVVDVPIQFDLESCRAREYDRDEVVELFRKLEFRSLLDRLSSLQETAQDQQMDLFVSQSPTEVDTETIMVIEPEGLESLVERLKGAESISFDVETTGTDAMRAKLVGISLAIQEGQGYYIPVGHDPEFAGGPQLPLEQVVSALKGPLTDVKIPKTGHNLKYDYTVLARNGLEVKPLAFDTMIAEWLCDPGSRNLGLKDLAWLRLGVEMTKIEQIIGSGRDQKTMAEVPIAQAAPYAAADADIPLRLMGPLEKDMRDRQVLSLFHDLEMPLVPILADMEMTGIRLDTEFLKNFAQELDRKLEAIEDEIFQHAGQEFNINSTQQLSQVLFDDLQLEPPDRTRRTSSGYYSTAASVLNDMKDAHPIVELILEQREISKLKSTYAQALADQVNPETGRVHTSFNQTGSVTGRLASSDPNLQNIPIRTELGREIRRAFISDPGHVLLSVDYSQIELRIVAHVAEDEAMIKAFKEDQDIHKATAAAVFDVDPDQVTSEQRRRAKAVNFGLIYGMSPFGLTRSTDLTLAEAEQFVERYFEQFPGVHTYLERIRVQAQEAGYVETLLGRRRYFPELTDSGKPAPGHVRSRALREAVNAPIQGTAADIIKLAMNRLPGALKEHQLAGRMLIQVHDELLLECPEGELGATAEVVQMVMQRAYKLMVPLRTDASSGTDWATMKPLD